MKQTITKLLSCIVILLTGWLTLSPALTLAIDCNTCSSQANGGLTSQQAIECGTSCASGNNQDTTQATNQVNSTIRAVVNILSVAVGILAVIMVIIGGFRYITSGGKQESVASAKNTILYAVVGLVVVALAQVIVRFVLTTATQPPTGQGAGSSQCADGRPVC